MPGRATVTGWTNSSDFPATPGAFDTSYNGSYPYYEEDAFVARLNAAGSALDYATFLGGSSYDQGNALALDAAGRATVTGWTGSATSPPPRRFRSQLQRRLSDAFVVRLNAAGSTAVRRLLGGEAGM